MVLSVDSIKKLVLAASGGTLSTKVTVRMLGVRCGSEGSETHVLGITKDGRRPDRQGFSLLPLREAVTCHC